VWDYYRKNPQALAEVRAPIFEEKVVDHILSQVKLVETSVSKDVLMGEDEEEADAAAKAEKPKKAPAKKAKKAE
jgi:trigger factor